MTPANSHPSQAAGCTPTVASELVRLWDAGIRPQITKGGLCEEQEFAALVRLARKEGSQVALLNAECDHWQALAQVGSLGELSDAHDKLSKVLEDETAGNDDLREAAIDMCAALNCVHEGHAASAPTMARQLAEQAAEIEIRNKHIRALESKLGHAEWQGQQQAARIERLETALKAAEIRMTAMGWDNGPHYPLNGAAIQQARAALSGKAVTP